MCLHVLPSWTHSLPRRTQTHPKPILRTISNTHKSCHSLSVSHTDFFMLQCVYFFPQTLRNKERVKMTSICLLSLYILTCSLWNTLRTINLCSTTCLHVCTWKLCLRAIYLCEQNAFILFIYTPIENVLLHAYLVCSIMPSIWPLAFYCHLLSLFCIFLMFKKRFKFFLNNSDKCVSRSDRKPDLLPNSKMENYTR